MYIDIDTHQERQLKQNVGVAQECVGLYLATFFHIQTYSGIGLLGGSSRSENIGHDEQLDCRYSLKSSGELLSGDKGITAPCLTRRSPQVHLKKSGAPGRRRGSQTKTSRAQRESTLKPVAESSQRAKTACFFRWKKSPRT